MRALDDAGTDANADAADRVYRLVGSSGLDAQDMPDVEQLLDSTLGYFICPGSHSMTDDDWEVFLDYCDRHLEKP